MVLILLRVLSDDDSIGWDDVSIGLSGMMLVLVGLLSDDVERMFGVWGF